MLIFIQSQENNKKPRVQCWEINHHRTRNQRQITTPNNTMTLFKCPVKKCGHFFRWNKDTCALLPQSGGVPNLKRDWKGNKKFQTFRRSVVSHWMASIGEEKIKHGAYLPRCAGGYQSAYDIALKQSI